MTTTPYPFQLRGVRRIERWNGQALLCDEQGLGKTLQSLLFLQRNPDALPAVVVCPAGLKWNWEREAKTHVGLRAEVLEGTKPPRRGLHRDPPLYIVNYDILHNWVDWLRECAPRTLIGDEFHYCSNPRARRSKAFRALARGVPHVLGLTGTPVMNRPVELWNLVDMIRPDLFPSRWAFCHRYCRPRRTPWGWDFSGASHLDELHDVLKHGRNGTPGVLIRRRKAQVLKDLPRKQRSVVLLDITNRREYQKVLTNFVGWLRGAAPHKLRKAARAEALVQMGYLLRLTAKGKRAAVNEWVDNWLAGSDGKMILFATHRKVLHGLHDRYNGRSVVVDGSVVGKRRQLAWDEFLGRRRTRLLLGNIKAAGVGHSAKGVGDTAFVEYPWTPGALFQAEDRTHGLGRGVAGERSRVWFLVAKNTIEEKLLTALERKHRIASAVVDGGRAEAFDVVDQVARELLKEGKR